MIQIPGGTYAIGTDLPDGFSTDKEGPRISVTIGDFFIDETTVTNQEFEKFVAATKYVTEAETFGWSFVFHYFLRDEVKEKSRRVPQLTWWYAVDGADWRHPEGPGSSIKERMDHPVVQISRNDAVAYCQWADKRLPTEAEWEIAAKGGTDSERYPWGKELMENDQYHCNIWQGDFPITNDLSDGFAGTAPVRSYEPNGYGMYQVIGNVWEWCSNPARIDLTDFQYKSATDFWESNQEINDASYATRGGSFLCHQSYCKRYRLAARNGNTGSSAANNLGFRCVKSQ